MKCVSQPDVCIEKNAFYRISFFFFLGWMWKKRRFFWCSREMQLQFNVYALLIVFFLLFSINEGIIIKILRNLHNESDFKAFVLSSHKNAFRLYFFYVVKRSMAMLHNFATINHSEGSLLLRLHARFHKFYFNFVESGNFSSQWD